VNGGDGEGTPNRETCAPLWCCPGQKHAEWQKKGDHFRGMHRLNGGALIFAVDVITQFDWSAK